MKTSRGLALAAVLCAGAFAAVPFLSGSPTPVPHGSAPPKFTLPTGPWSSNALQGNKIALPPVSLPRLSIPKTHPRLWYSMQPGSPGKARLARARAYVASHPIVHESGDETHDAMRNLALKSLLANHPAPGDCNTALNWLRGYNFPSIDEARWSGENAILIYDWCHHRLTAADRIPHQQTADGNDGNESLLFRWNKRLKFLLDEQDWGNVHQAANNYYHGYMRLGALWAIASAYENPEWKAFFRRALETRYIARSSPPAPGTNIFATWYGLFGRGGISLEGLQYGPYVLGYPVIAFTSFTDYGYDAWNLSPFWRDALYGLHYQTMPAKTVRVDGAAPRWEMFPFNDDQFFELGGSAENGEYADMIAAWMLRNPDSVHARVGRDWLAKVGVQPSWWVRPELAALNVTGPGPGLPLDYYAQGAQYLYGRRDQATDGSAFMFQMGGFSAYHLEPEGLQFGGVGHNHLDVGNFQLWRKGRWLSRETTGYAIDTDGVRGFNGVGIVDPREAVAHNAVLFEGRGQIDRFKALPVVQRLQSHADFAYGAVDMTGAYRYDVVNSWDAEDDWPYAEHAVRELLYLRQMDALVVLDRLQSGSDSQHPWYADPDFHGPRITAQQVRKSFVLHAGGSSGSGSGVNPFTTGANTASAAIGDQRLDLATLLPANPAYRVIQEDAQDGPRGRIGQFRIEYDVSGSAESYLLNVVSMRDAGDAAVSATLSTSGNTWTITLMRPGRDTVTLTLEKGLVSQGGSVRVGAGPVHALRTSVQGFSITGAGPVWEDPAALQATTKSRRHASRRGSTSRTEAKPAVLRSNPHPRRPAALGR